MTLKLAREIHELSVREVSKIHFDAADDWDRVVVSLYASMVEKTGSILTLFGNDVDAGSDAIFRALLEAYVDLINLLADRSYIDISHYSYHAEWLKVLKESQKGNPFLKGMADHDQFDKALSYHQGAIEKLNARGAAKLSILDRFIKAGMEDVYRSAYNFASAESHNNIRSLIDRHLAIAETGIEVVAYRGFNEEDHVAQLDSICGIMAKCGIDVHDHFKSGRSQVFSDYKQRLAEHREAA